MGLTDIENFRTEGEKTQHLAFSIEIINKINRLKIRLADTPHHRFLDIRIQLGLFKIVSLKIQYV